MANIPGSSLILPLWAAFGHQMKNREPTVKLKDTRITVKITSPVLLLILLSHICTPTVHWLQTAEESPNSLLSCDETFGGYSNYYCSIFRHG